MTIVTRVQTGVRIEARLLSVLKALAALKNTSLGDLLEGIVLHAFDGQQAFSASTLAQIAELKKIYGLELSAADSHQLVESERAVARATPKRTASTAKRGRKR
ncbi:hypothetical protein JM946_04435 [Steroidobacter sp. S1-65]|uniref:Uncharacterized protein n=1 Tax=Steroidobacter gossypii TaxID=2805490 RepID=A0ABS1WSL7_9GAMM|nr:hypothetical protein [Steroidobacter gossypii]MBM0103975.1 hypothetical protein [Steroidobacter gossypii]